MPFARKRAFNGNQYVADPNDPRGKRKAEQLETEASGRSGKLRKTQQPVAPNSPPQPRARRGDSIFDFPKTPPSKNTRSSARRFKHVALSGRHAAGAYRAETALSPLKIDMLEEVVEAPQDSEEDDAERQGSVDEEHADEEGEGDDVEDSGSDDEDQSEGEDEEDDGDEEDEEDDEEVGGDEQAHGDDEGAEEDRSRANEKQGAGGPATEAGADGKRDDASVGSRTNTKKRRRGRPKGSSNKSKKQPEPALEEPQEPPEVVDEPQESSEEVHELCLLQSEEASVTDSIDWLGLDVAWQAISSKTNELIDLVHDDSINLQTEIAQSICEEIVAVIKGLDSTPAPRTDALQSLATQIKNLRVELKPFQSTSGQGKNDLPDDSGILQDLYAHVVPRLVYLVAAYASRFSERYTPLDDTEHLDAVANVLSLALRFCETIRSARATLEAKVIRFTSRTILPMIRLIHQCFASELRQRLDEQQKRVEDEAAETRRRALQRFEREQERRRKLDIERKRAERWEWYSQHAKTAPAVAAPLEPEVESPVEPSTGWSWEMDDQLVKTLWRKRKSSRMPPRCALSFRTLLTQKQWEIGIWSA